MELIELCTKLKFEHLPAQLDTLCEQAAKRELNYPWRNQRSCRAR
jgi:hypothetical protein